MVMASSCETTAAASANAQPRVLRPRKPTNYHSLNQFSTADLYSAAASSAVTSRTSIEEHLVLPLTTEADDDDPDLPTGCYTVERLVTQRNVKVCIANWTARMAEPLTNWPARMAELTVVYCHYSVYYRANLSTWSYGRALARRKHPGSRPRISLNQLNSTFKYNSRA